MCTYLSTQWEITDAKIRVDCDSSCQCQLNILHIYHPVSYWEDIFRSCVQHILKPSLPCSFCIWAYISFTLSRLYIPFETCGCFQILMKFYKIHYQEVRIFKIWTWLPGKIYLCHFGRSLTKWKTSFLLYLKWFGAPCKFHAVFHYFAPKQASYWHKLHKWVGVSLNWCEPYDGLMGH
jgi:hypothetical protein